MYADSILYIFQIYDSIYYYLFPKEEILDKTGRSDSLSNSSEESYSAAIPNWKPFVKSLQEFQEQLPELSELSTEKVNILFNSKHVLVGDSVGIRLLLQHYLIEEGIIVTHFFNLIAINNRIKIPNGLTDVKALRPDVLDIPITNALPSKMDEFALREEMKILVTRELF